MVGRIQAKGVHDVPDGFDVFDPTSPDESLDLRLPVTRTEFGDFLGRLISGKDKLEYAFKGNIHISTEVVSGIEAALIERVEGQNSGRLASSRYEIRFSNGRGFKTSSIERLLELSPRGDATTEFLSIELFF
jgi:hypothetical protein